MFWCYGARDDNNNGSWMELYLFPACTWVCLVVYNTACLAVGHEKANQIAQTMDEL
jgi:hypothetical protein